MGEDDEKKQQMEDPQDVLQRWLIARVVSSFKCKPEQGDALLAQEVSYGAINQFLTDVECPRLMIIAAPDLVAVRIVPAPRFLCRGSPSARRRARRPRRAADRRRSIALGSNPQTPQTAIK